MSVFWKDCWWKKSQHNDGIITYDFRSFLGNLFWYSPYQRVLSGFLPYMLHVMITSWLTNLSGPWISASLLIVCLRQTLDDEILGIFCKVDYDYNIQKTWYSWKLDVVGAPPPPHPKKDTPPKDDMDDFFPKFYLKINSYSYSLKNPEPSWKHQTLLMTPLGLQNRSFRDPMTS